MKIFQTQYISEIGSKNLLKLEAGEVHLWAGACVGRQGRQEILQQIARKYVGDSCKELFMSQLPFGKPVFKEGLLHFSLSHTENKLLAVFANFAVGVDIEASNREVALKAVARRYFHPSEYAFLEACPEAERQTVFLRMWVCKEAAVKMSGKGLSRELRKIVVNPLQEGFSLSRGEEPLFVKEIIPWPGIIGAIVAPCRFAVTAYREF